MKVHSLIYRYLILLLLLVLPLQGFAAVLMPLQMFNTSVSTSDMRDDTPCHNHAVGVDSKLTQISQQCCDSCSLCHLSRVFTSLSFQLIFPLLTAEQPAMVIVSQFVSHIPQRPQRPPRSTLV